MPITNLELETYINTELKAHKFRDYCPNGLQVEGKQEIQRIVSGVTASQQLIDAAVEQGADAVLVHHGYFWRNEPAQIRGMKKRRIATLLKHDINLFGYHLPLDAHPTLGNNAQLAQLLGFEAESLIDPTDPYSVGNIGKPTKPMTLDEMGALVADKLARQPLLVSGGDHVIKTVAWCTGGAQGYIDKLVGQGVDAYISGEISESTVHSARENGIHYVAAGHHATERYGAKALGEHLSETFSLEHVFIDSENPA